MMEQLETFVVTTCSACLDPSGAGVHTGDQRCRKFRRAQVEKAGRLKRRKAAVSKIPDMRKPRVVSGAGSSSSSSTSIPPLNSSSSATPHSLAPPGQSDVSMDDEEEGVQRKVALWLYAEAGDRSNPNRTVYLGLDSNGQRGPIYGELKMDESMRACDMPICASAFGYRETRCSVKIAR